MNEQEIEFFRREAFELAVDVTDNEGKAVDLKGYVAYFTIKSNTTDADDKAKLGPLAGVIATPETGMVVFPITTADTENINEGKYYFDIVIYNSSTGQRSVVAFGEALVYNGVTINM